MENRKDKIKSDVRKRYLKHMENPEYRDKLHVYSRARYARAKCPELREKQTKYCRDHKDNLVKEYLRLHPNGPYLTKNAMYHAMAPKYRIKWDQ